MSVTDAKVIDLIGISNHDGVITLTITDHLEWDDISEHELILQTKINTYLRYIESGEILERFPDARTRGTRISVIFKYPPDEGGRDFLAQIRRLLQDWGIQFETEVFRQ